MVFPQEEVQSIDLEGVLIWYDVISYQRIQRTIILDQLVIPIPLRPMQGVEVDIFAAVEGVTQIYDSADTIFLQERKEIFGIELLKEVMEYQTVAANPEVLISD
jgi:hypothetical protein